MSAAVRGKQIETVKILCSQFEFTTEDKSHHLTDHLDKEEANILFYRYNRDVAKNNCWHYSYMQDSPEIREAFRQADIRQDGAAKQNWRGQKPKDLRHAQKAEVSSGESEEEDLEEDRIFEKDEAQQLGLVLESKSKKIKKKKEELANTDNVMLFERNNIDVKQIESYNIEIDEFMMYDLKSTNLINRKQKLANYDDPDYCFLVKKQYMGLVLLELKPLFERGGVYFKIYNKIDKVDDFDNPAGFVERQTLLLFFDDSVIDMMGERMKMNCKLANYDIELPFIGYAIDHFEPFNTRQIQAIIQEMLDEELDIKHFTSNQIILDHFPVHNNRQQIYETWTQNSISFAMGMVTGNYEKNMLPLNYIRGYYGEK